MSKANSFYDSNSEWVDDSRAGWPGFPVYLPTQDWLRALDVEPALLIRGIEHWWQVATSAVDHILAGEIPEVPSGFTSLTDLLVLLCDSLGTIDAAPLKKAHDAVYAREGELHDLVTTTSWPPVSEIQKILADSLPIKDRIKTLARARLEELDRVESGKGNAKQALRERIAMVRRVLADLGKTDATREAIRKGLTDRYGQGMNNQTLEKVLDHLRKTGEYTVPKRTRVKKTK